MFTTYKNYEAKYIWNLYKDRIRLKLAIRAAMESHDQRHLRKSDLFYDCYLFNSNMRN